MDPSFLYSSLITFSAALFLPPFLNTSLNRKNVCAPVVNKSMIYIVFMFTRVALMKLNIINVFANIYALILSSFFFSLSFNALLQFYLSFTLPFSYSLFPHRLQVFVSFLLSFSPKFWSVCNFCKAQFFFFFLLLWSQV